MLNVKDWCKVHTDVIWPNVITEHLMAYKLPEI